MKRETIKMAMHAKLSCIAILLLTASAARGQASAWQKAVDAALRVEPAARIVVIDKKSGKLVAAAHLDDAARTLAEPGSTLKPLILFQMVAAGHWEPTRRVACARNLQIAGRRLNCSHPAMTPMDASEALTWSCNSYFAEVAEHVRPDELETMLRKTGLLGQSGLAANEASAVFHAPESVEKTKLAFLGVDGVRVTPLELVEAYRWLALELEKAPTAKLDYGAAETVRAGLTDSASYGMAGSAGMGGVPVMGKTGTASLGGLKQTHGWFAGIAGDVVMVVYLPAGRGMDAAQIAGVVLKGSPLVKR
jgi:cell division protein FtsI/penicillin-binding protein 2